VNARGTRYLAVYLALLTVLVGLRYATRDTHPALLALQDREEALELRRKQLELDVQRLESPSRVRDWAAKNEMVPYSTAEHKFINLKALPDVPAVKAPTPKVKVRTEWR
jgi:hypothetical protein